jgi:hypothetical protein
MCVRVFIRINDRTCTSIYIYIVFIKKKIDLWVSAKQRWFRFVRESSDMLVVSRALFTTGNGYTLRVKQGKVTSSNPEVFFLSSLR